MAGGCLSLGFRPKLNSPAGLADRAMRLFALGNVMLIKNHDKSRIVELEDGSLWRIWPGDLALTLNWLPTCAFRKLVTSFAPTRLSIKPMAHGCVLSKQARIGPLNRCSGS